MNEDFAPSKLFFRLIRFWWIVAVLMIFGGLVGILASKILRPVYESKSVITSVLDYSSLQKLDDAQEDQIFVAIGQLIDSTKVKDAVFQEAQSEGIPLTRNALLDNLTADRMDNRWVLHVRSTDAQTAQKINVIWANQSMLALENMHKNAVLNFASQQYINSLATCLQQSVIVGNTAGNCTIDNYADLQKEIKDVGSDPASKLDPDTLLFLHTSFEVTQEPSLPGSPVLYARNILALAGILIGLAISLILLSLDLPFFNEKKGN